MTDLQVIVGVSIIILTWLVVILVMSEGDK